MMMMAAQKTSNTSKWQNKQKCQIMNEQAKKVKKIRIYNALRMCMGKCWKKRKFQITPPPFKKPAMAITTKSSSIHLCARILRLYSYKVVLFTTSVQIASLAHFSIHSILSLSSCWYNNHNFNCIIHQSNKDKDDMKWSF